MSGAKLQQKILAFMEAGPLDERIFRRHELDRFGSAAEVDRALDRLARARKIGSPAEGVWFPIHFVAGLEHPIPHASLRRLAVSLLRREGVTTCTSRQERNYRLFHETDGREGVWGVPNFEAIGVEQPVRLSLLWNQGGAYTECEYQDDRMENWDDFGFTATGIHDPQKLCRRAEQLDLAPARIEKDVCVNAALKGLGHAPWPSGGCLLFAGGTSLVKSWRLSPRFSEDVDFWYLDRAYPPNFSEGRKREVHSHLFRMLEQQVLPFIPGSAIDLGKSAYRTGFPVQRVFVNYPSAVDVGHSGTLKLEVMFTRFVPDWEPRSVRALPALAGPMDELVSQYPCVATWATMTGKLQALTLMHPGEDVQDMRHVHDLGVWVLNRSHRPYHPRMVQQAFVERRVGDLLDGLLPALEAFAESEECHRAYHQYVMGMYPSSYRTDAPSFDAALDAIRNLWLAMCESDWENPAYAPGPVALPSEHDFKDPPPRDETASPGDGKIRAAWSARDADPDADSYSEYWRKRNTRNG